MEKQEDGQGHHTGQRQAIHPAAPSEASPLSDGKTLQATGEEEGPCVTVHNGGGTQGDGHGPQG